MCAVSKKLFAVTSGSSWMFQAPNLHLAMQLLIDNYLFLNTKQLI